MAFDLRGEAMFQHEFTPGVPETLTLLLTANALMRAERESGINMLRDMGGGMPSLVFSSHLLRSGLIEGCQREFDVESACEILLLNTAALQALLEALNMSLPKPKEAADTANPPKAARKSGTGKKF